MRDVYFYEGKVPLNANLVRSLLVTFSILTSLNSLAVDFFGYYGTYINGVAGDSSKNSDAVEARFKALRPVSNTVYIRGESAQDVLAKLKIAQQLGMAAIVNVQHILFPWKSALICSSANCLTDYRMAFWQFHEAIKAYDYMIAAYFIFDEPYWNNYLGSIHQVPYVSTWNQNVYWNLYAAIDAVKTFAPNKPTAIVFSFAEVQGLAGAFQWFIPTNLDWIGFDGYLAAGCDDNCVVNEFNTFVSISKRSGQKIMVFPDSYWNTTPNSTEVEYLLNRIQLWKQLIAQNSSRIVAVLPFIYQSDLSINLVGAEAIPEVKSCLGAYYQKLIGQAACSNGNLISLRDPSLFCAGDWSCR